MPSGEFPASATSCRALITRATDDEELGFTRMYIPACRPSSLLAIFPLVMERPPSQGSILTDTSSPDSLFSKFSEVSEAKVHTTRPSRTLPDAVPDILFSPVLDHVCELKHQPAPLLHLGDTSVQPAYKLPRILPWILSRIVPRTFLSPPRPARRPSFDHGTSVTT